MFILGRHGGLPLPNLLQEGGELLEADEGEEGPGGQDDGDGHNVTEVMPELVEKEPAVTYEE